MRVQLVPLAARLGYPIHDITGYGNGIIQSHHIHKLSSVHKAINHLSINEVIGHHFLSNTMNYIIILQNDDDCRLRDFSSCCFYILILTTAVFIQQYSNYEHPVIAEHLTLLS